MLILVLIMINKSTVLIKSFKKILYVFFIFNLLFSQYGKNIVQYDDFDWNYIQTEHFDINTYSSGMEHADLVAKESEEWRSLFTMFLIAGFGAVMLLISVIGNRNDALPLAVRWNWFGR